MLVLDWARLIRLLRLPVALVARILAILVVLLVRHTSSILLRVHFARLGAVVPPISRARWFGACK